MKDMPALLCAWLSARSPALFETIFGRVIDNGKMLRNFVQIVRSGVCGRRSLGSLPKRMIRRWFAERSDDDVFYAVAGANPSLADIVRLSHPRPETESRAALYRWLLGYQVSFERLPPRVGSFLAWKERRKDRPDEAEADGGDLPEVPFLLLKGCSLSRRELERLVPRLS